MRSEIVIKKEKIKRLRNEISSDYKERSTARGKAVRYVMPALKDPFPKLLAIINSSNHRKKLHDVFYYFETKNHYLKFLTPASVYYLNVFRSVADKIYSTNLSVMHIKEIVGRIDKNFTFNREILPKTGQSSINLDEEVYELKTDIAAFLFNTRSILDSMATLMHFLYWPSSRQFSSFADYIKYIRKKSRGPGEIPDEVMKSYINDNMQWFFQLRDIRDFITHYSSIDISFNEEDNAVLRVYIHNHFDLNDFVDSVSNGLNNFLRFFDDHFSRVVANQNKD